MSLIQLAFTRARFYSFINTLPLATRAAYQGRATFLLVLTASFVVLCSSRICAAQCATPPAGLVAWWGSTHDLIEPRADGSLLGNASVQPEHIGCYVSIPDASSAFEVPHTPKLLVGATFTVGGWARLVTGFPSSSLLFEKSNNQSGFLLEISVFQGGDGGSLCWALASNGQHAGLCHSDIQQLTGNQWHHVAMAVYPASIRFFIDGAFWREEARGSLLGPCGTTAPLRVTGENASMDEWQIFNRALSDAEVLSIYEAGLDGVCKPTPVVSLDNTPTLFPIGSNLVADATASMHYSAFRTWCLCATSSFGGPCIPAEEICQSPFDNQSALFDWGVRPAGTYLLTAEVIVDDCGGTRTVTKHVAVGNSVPSVPTLSEWATLALGIGVLLAGGVVIRCRLSA